MCGALWHPVPMFPSRVTASHVCLNSGKRSFNIAGGKGMVFALSLQPRGAHVIASVQVWKPKLEVTGVRRMVFQHPSLFWPVQPGPGTGQDGAMGAEPGRASYSSELCSSLRSDCLLKCHCIIVVSLGLPFRQQSGLQTLARSLQDAACLAGLSFT